MQLSSYLFFKSIPYYKSKGKTNVHERYSSNGFKPADKEIVDKFKIECSLKVKISRITYLKNLGNKLSDTTTGPKAYWSIVNSFLN